MSSCYTCAYKGNVPGDAHICCKFDWINAEVKPPQASQYALKKGWYFFPANFDPAWQEEECKAFSTTVDPEKVGKEDPLMTLLSLLGKRF